MLRLISLATTAIALLYALEFAGVVPERAYFPTLPRLEATTNTPAAWAGAAAWGLERLPKLATLQANLPMPQADTNTPHHGKFTDRVVAKDKTATPKG